MSATVRHDRSQCPDHVPVIDSKHLRDASARLSKLPALEGAMPTTFDEIVRAVKGAAYRYEESYESYGWGIHECLPLLEVVMAARRLMIPGDVQDTLFRGDRGFCSKLTMATDMWTDGPESIFAHESARHWLAQDKARVAKLRRAAELLHEAAEIIGVRPSIFITSLNGEEWESRQQTADGVAPEMGAIVTAPATRIEGETEDENRLREALCTAVLCGFTDAWPAYLSAFLMPYDRTGGASTSTRALVIRMLWDALPFELQTRVPRVWEPYSVIARSLRWAGYSADSRLVRATVVG